VATRGGHALLTCVVALVRYRYCYTALL